MLCTASAVCQSDQSVRQPRGRRGLCQESIRTCAREQDRRSGRQEVETLHPTLSPEYHLAPTHGWIVSGESRTDSWSHTLPHFSNTNLSNFEASAEELLGTDNFLTLWQDPSDWVGVYHT